MGALHVQSDVYSEFAKKYGVRFVVLHGSHAVGNTHDTSDVDIAIMFDGRFLRQLSMREYAALLEDLAGCLGIMAEKIDLSCLRSANILLRYEVTLKGILLYGDPEAYEEFYAFAYREYLDARSLFDLEHALILKRQTFIQNYVAR